MSGLYAPAQAQGLCVCGALGCCSGAWSHYNATVTCEGRARVSVNSTAYTRILSSPFSPHAEVDAAASAAASEFHLAAPGRACRRLLDTTTKMARMTMTSMIAASRRAPKRVASASASFASSCAHPRPPVRSAAALAVETEDGENVGAAVGGAPEMGAFAGVVTGAGVGDPTQMEQLIGHVVRSNATIGQYVAARLAVTWLQLVTEANIVPCVSAVTVASLALAQSGAIVGATVGAASTLVIAANRTTIVSCCERGRGSDSTGKSVN